jgi:hypothetical protein
MPLRTIGSSDFIGITFDDEDDSVVFLPYSGKVLLVNSHALHGLSNSNESRTDQQSAELADFLGHLGVNVS